jgi:hypothetical protein
MAVQRHSCQRDSRGSVVTVEQRERTGNAFSD